MTAVDFKIEAEASTGDYDLELAANGDLATVEDLSTAILVSILTDARATPEQEGTPQLRRGWICNAAPPVPGYELGSLVWLVDQSRATQSAVNRAAGYARSALQWFVDQGIASAIDVEGRLTGPGQGELAITIRVRTGEIERQYIQLWERTAFVAQGLPAPIVDLPPFSPMAVPGLIVWGDADLSDHDIDSSCGVVNLQDLAGTADLSQATAGRRPLHLLGSGGWLWRFDGTDDFLATANLLFQNLNQGTAFFVLRQAVSVTAGDRVFALGFAGLTDVVKGLTVRQQDGNVLRLAGDNGNLEVDIQGLPNDAPSLGVIFRWGSAAQGANAETTTLEAESDPSYVNDIGQPNIAILGAGFDGSSPDTDTAAAFDAKLFALWDRKIADVDLARLLDYALSRSFTSPTDEHFADCTFWSDDQGWVE